MTATEPQPAGFTVIDVEGLDEAPSVANDAAYGLSASVVAQNVPSALQLAQRIERGICHAKDATAHDEPQMPFGGVKAGGLGRFGVKQGLEAFTQLRWITVQHLPRHDPI